MSRQTLQCLWISTLSSTAPDLSAENLTEGRSSVIALTDAASEGKQKRTGKKRLHRNCQNPKLLAASSNHRRVDEKRLQRIPASQPSASVA